MLDHLITGATVVDGTGAPAYTADVGIRDGRIAVIAEPGTVTEEAATARGRHRSRPRPRLRRPAHPLRRPALLGPVRHPVHEPRRDHRRGRQLRVHPRPAAPGPARGRRLHPPHDVQGRGMSLKSPWRRASTWTWSTFGEYLDALEGRIAVNAGFMVGHCALRRHVMGADAVGGQPTRASSTPMLRALPRRDGRRRLGPVHHPVLHPLRRRRASPSPPGTRCPRSCSLCPGPSASTRAPRSRRSSRAASTSSATTRSTSSST